MNTITKLFRHLAGLDYAMAESGGVDCKSTNGTTRIANPLQRVGNVLLNIQGSRMKRLILFGIFALQFVFSYGQQIHLSETSPANNEKVSSIQKVLLTYDLSEIYAAYPDVPQEEWGIVASWGTDERQAKLYKGSVEEGNIVASKWFSNSSTYTPGTNVLEFSFDNLIILESGETYTLFISKNTYAKSATTKAITTSKPDEDTYVTIIGASDDVLSLKSYIPTNETPLKKADKFTLSFSGDVKVADGAKAYIYEDDKEVAQSVNISVDADDASVVDVDFGGVTLYNSHKYSVVIPENSILSASDNIGYQEIRLDNYQGADYYYDITLASASPTDKSEVSYFTEVEMNFNFPDGYNLGYHTKDCKMYLYKEGTEEPIGEYVTDYNSAATGLVATISKYDLEAGATYRVVFPEGQIVPGEIGQTLAQYDLQDTSNPEIVLTYTTPVNLEPLHRVEGLTGSVESDGSIKVVVPSYDFNGTTMTVYPVEGATGVTKKTETVNQGAGDTQVVSYFITCPLYDTTGGTQEKVGDLEMEFTPNPYSDDEIWLVGTAPQSLYAGRTYSLTIPAGTLAPRGMEDVTSLVSNEEITLPLEGTADPNALVVSGGVAEGKELPELGVVAYYAEGAVTAADGAVVKLTQGETVVKEVPVVVATASGSTMLVADFCDESHAPLALEEGAAYTLVLPQGSVVGSDGIMTNAEKATSLTGAAAVTEPEMVNVTLTVGDNASTVAQAVKGKAYTVTVTPETDWTIESLTVGSEDVTSEMSNGSYTIAELTADTEIIATLSYDESKLTFADVSTGIASVEGTDIKAYSEGSEIVVEGLAAGDTVTVYTVGGMRLASHKATNDSVRIAAPAGATYIVKVNSHAIKMAH